MPVYGVFASPLTKKGTGKSILSLRLKEFDLLKSKALADGYYTIDDQQQLLSYLESIKGVARDEGEVLEIDTRIQEMKNSIQQSSVGSGSDAIDTMRDEYNQGSLKLAQLFSPSVIDGSVSYVDKTKTESGVSILNALNEEMLQRALYEQASINQSGKQSDKEKAQDFVNELLAKKETFVGIINAIQQKDIAALRNYRLMVNTTTDGKVKDWGIFGMDEKIPEQRFGNKSEYGEVVLSGVDKETGGVPVFVRKYKDTNGEYKINLGGKEAVVLGDEAVTLTDDVPLSLSQRAKTTSFLGSPNGSFLKPIGTKDMLFKKNDGRYMRFSNEKDLQTFLQINPQYAQSASNPIVIIPEDAQRIAADNPSLIQNFTKETALSLQAQRMKFLDEQRQRKIAEDSNVSLQTGRAALRVLASPVGGAVELTKDIARNVGPKVSALAEQVGPKGGVTKKFAKAQEKAGLTSSTIPKPLQNLQIGAKFAQVAQAGKDFLSGLFGK